MNCGYQKVVKIVGKRICVNRNMTAYFEPIGFYNFCKRFKEGMKAYMFEMGNATC
jgi:hypothetical protein